MDKRLSRWVTTALAFIILISSAALTAAEEAVPNGSESSAATTGKPNVDLSQYKTLTIGSTGPEVAALNQRMYELGYSRRNTVSESYSSNTAVYVKKFEKKNGLPVDGIADPEMMALFFSGPALRSDGKLASSELRMAEEVEAQVSNSQYKTLTIGSTGPEVLALKQRLYDLGYSKRGMVNDSYDVQTDVYVRRFEKLCGLPVDGDADPEMQALLFSDSAPRGSEPPASPVSQHVYMTEEEKEEQVNQRFSDFLNGVGEYDEEKLKRKLATYAFEFRDLGFFAIGLDEHFWIQAILLHYETVNQNQYLALGIKNRKGKRNIVVVEWATELLIKSGGRVVKPYGSSDNTYIPYSTVEETKDLLEASLEDRIIPFFAFQKRYPSEGSSYHLSNLIDYLNSKNSTNLSFAAGLLWPKNKATKGEKSLYNMIKNVKTKIGSITSLSEMKEKILTGDNIPVMWEYQYRLR